MAYGALPPIRYAPTTGTSQTMVSFDGGYQSVYIVPAGTIAAFGVVLPAAIDGQTVRIYSTQQITLLTVTSSNSQSGSATTVNSGAQLIALNGSLSWTYSETDKAWLKGA